MTKKTLRVDGPEPDHENLPLIISVAEARRILGPTAANWSDHEVAKLITQFDLFATGLIRHLKTYPPK